MKILSGEKATNWNDAVGLAFHAAGVEVTSADIIDMFSSLTAGDKINGEADKSIGAAVKSRYGSKATWRAERWFVAVPRLQYDGKNVPQLIIESATYLVAQITVNTPADSRWMTVVGPNGRPETLAIPLIFLHALLEKDPGRFAIVARDSVYTTWEVPGARPVRLPNAFIVELMEMLKYKSVVDWLGEFGVQGKCVAPLVAGSLLGLAFQDSSWPVAVSQEMVTTDNLVGALEGMAYQPAEAMEMVRLAASRLRSDMTLEEAIRITLQTGKGGEQQ